jgi:hypothetical protein
MGLFTDLIPKELTPQEQKWSDEAAAVGLIWLKQTRYAFGLFRFVDCGHNQEITNDNVRKKSFRCKCCFNEKFKAEAELVNLTWLKQARPQYGLFLFKDCGHKQEIQNDAIRKNNFKCRFCYEKKLKEEAEAAGLTWIKQTRIGYGLFRFKDCGHEQEIQNTHVRLQTCFKCQLCFMEKLTTEAALVGLNWLKQTRQNYGLFRFNECGHQQEIANANVRRNRFKCQTCEDTWATKPSNVYVHSIELQAEAIIKVGIAKDVQSRIKYYGLPSEAIAQTLLVIPTKTGKEASDIEKIVLKKFKPYRVKNIGHIMTKSGATECFDVSKLSEILDFTKSLAEVK